MAPKRSKQFFAASAQEIEAGKTPSSKKAETEEDKRKILEAALPACHPYLEPTQYSSPDVNAPLDKIVFIQRILRFACKETLNVVQMSHINQTFRETVVDYNTAALVWYKMLGKNSLLYDPSLEEHNDFVEPSPPSSQQRESDAEEDEQQNFALFRGNAANRDLAQQRALAARNVARPAPAFAPAPTTALTVAHYQTPQSITQGMDRNLNLVFHTAVENGLLWVIRQLLAAGIRQQEGSSCKISEARGRYPLHVAVATGNMETIRCLVEHTLEYHKTPSKQNNNNNKNENDDDDQDHNDIEIEDDVDDTFKSIDINLRSGGKSALHFAVNISNQIVSRNNHDRGLPLKIVKLLIESGNANPNLVPNASHSGGYGPSLLHDCVDAMRGGNSGAGQILAYLISSVPGINLDPENSMDGDLTPLQLAVKKDQEDAVRILLENGANPNYQCQNPRSIKRTCLHLTAQSEDYKDPKMTILLLKHGAHPDIQECHNFTPLHVACMYGNLYMVETLLDAKDKHGGIKNAHPSLVDTCNQTPRDFARKRGYEKIVALLPESAADTVHDIPTEPTGIMSKVAELGVNRKSYTGASTTAKRVFDTSTGTTSIVSTAPSYAMTETAAAENRARAVARLRALERDRVANFRQVGGTNPRNQIQRQANQQQQQQQRQQQQRAVEDTDTTTDTTTTDTDSD